jgi:hypothetical protein
MSSNDSSELASFHEFVVQHLVNGDSQLSPEEALDLWRAGQPVRDEFSDTVAALGEAFADMDAGDTGQPIEEFLHEFRERRAAARRS